MTTLLFLLVACTTTASVGIDDEGFAEDGDTDVAADTDLGDTDDTAPPANPYAGEYDGTVLLAVPEWGWDVCEGDMTFTVTDDGALIGAGNCVSESNWGEPTETPVEITGDVDDTGAVTGLAAWDYSAGWGDPTHYEGEMIGQIDDEGAGLSWTAEVDVGGGNTGEVAGTVDAAK